MILRQRVLGWIPSVAAVAARFQPFRLRDSRRKSRSTFCQERSPEASSAPPSPTPGGAVPAGEHPRAQMHPHPFLGVVFRAAGQGHHGPLVRLYRKARAVAGVKRVLIGSGVRYDLAVRDPEYVRELVTHHVGGYLKIAPEHTEEGPLALMMKPGIGVYHRFKALFDRFSAEAGKEQYLIPYFIAAHPGSRDEDMLALALWLKANGFRPDQVQAFLPTPMALATAMYHSGHSPLRRVHRGDPALPVARGLRQRRLQKAFLRYHDPDNWPLLRDALKRMGRADLIGNGKRHLIPSFQPAGTGEKPPKRDSIRKGAAEPRRGASERSKKRSSPIKGRTPGRQGRRR